MPQLESLDLYCLSFVYPEDRIQINSFIARYASLGKRATCTQFI